MTEHEQAGEWIEPAPTTPIVPVPLAATELPARFRHLTPRSTAAAVLLNLTGAGFGYGYLRRPLRAAVSAGLAVALVAVAFWTDAAATPWLWRGLAAGWLAVLALDAARIAARHPRPDAHAARRPVLAGVLGVVVVAGGYVGYGAAGRHAYADGLAAQARADCAAATDEFDAVTGPYELTLSRTVAAAERAGVECDDYTRTTAIQRAGDHEAAARGYHRFRRDHPDSALAPFVDRGLVDAYTAWARGLRAGGDLAGAVEVYRDLLGEDTSFRPEVAETYLELARNGIETVGGDPLPSAGRVVEALEAIVGEFADTPAAGEVPAAFDQLYAAATEPYRRGRFCAALPVLEYFAGLSGQGARKVAGAAKGHFPRGMLHCGLAQLRRGDSAAAVSTLERFVSEFPRHGGVAQARSALIAAMVGAGTGERVPVPAPHGATGPITVTFVNGVNMPVDVRVAGSTAHEFRLPPCVTCPPHFPPSGGQAACPTVSGLPVRTVRLRAGAHQLLAEFGTADALAMALVAGDGRDLYCLYVERRF